jgi:hypothetical protein
MTAIFPSLPGLGWSVTKTPRFATRIQRAVSGREVRLLDQPMPIWSWTLTYTLLRDRWDVRGGTGPGSGPGAGYDELRTLMGLLPAAAGRLSVLPVQRPDRRPCERPAHRHR